MRPPPCGAADSSGAPPVWVLQSGSNNRRSVGSESDSGLPNGDRLVDITATLSSSLQLVCCHVK